MFRPYWRAQQVEVYQLPDILAKLKQSSCEVKAIWPTRDEAASPVVIVYVDTGRYPVGMNPTD
jgi:hypothetical protein